MTNVTVFLTNGSTRSFNTSYTSKDLVRSVALDTLGLRPGSNTSGLTVNDELALLAVLDDAFDPAKDNRVYSNDALTKAGISEVLVGLRAPVAPAVEDADDDDDEVPAVEDLPVYAQTVQAQERPAPLTLSKSPVASKVSDFTPKGLRLRHIAGIYAVAGVVVGFVAGAWIF